MSAYEYYLGVHGEVLNEDQRWLERDLGIVDQHFWFASAAERACLRARLKACADAHQCIICFLEYEGTDARLLTVARMVFRLPDGRAFNCRHNFGYGYPCSAAEYMFQEGNFACDCNRSLFIMHTVPGAIAKEWECGELIVMEDLRISKEPPAQACLP